jgi:hypothetical protein
VFERFPSLTRFSQGWTITEKIDGSNGQVLIRHAEGRAAWGDQEHDYAILDKVGDFFVYAGSRNRLLTVENDHAGFAKWVLANAEMLVTTLGEGRHFGEWWGQGIQRNYGLKEKRFSLFNTHRWKQADLPEGLHVVPCLLDNAYADEPSGYANMAMRRLKEGGSLASPGFMDPEGIVMHHRASGATFKKTFDYDEFGKWKENQERKEVVAV